MAVETAVLVAMLHQIMVLVAVQEGILAQVAMVLALVLRRQALAAAAAVDTTQAQIIFTLAAAAVLEY